MRKKKTLLAMLLACSVAMTGCGTIDSQKKSNDSSSAETSEQKEATSDVSKMTAAPVETPKLQEETFSSEQAYSDSDREVTILGFKEYKKLKSEQFTDKAPKGKKYLVLFLKVRNKTSEDDYFNQNYVSAKIDGKEITNTYLLNEPQGYGTLFDTIEAERSLGGFIVWEVPENWKKLSFTYDGWKNISGLSLSATLTKDDFAKPEKYSELSFDH